MAMISLSALRGGCFPLFIPYPYSQLSVANSRSRKISFRSKAFTLFARYSQAQDRSSSRVQDSIENLPKLVEDIIQTSINTGPRGALRLAQGIQAFIGVGGEWLADLSKSTSSSTGLPTQMQLGLISPLYLRKLFERMGATYIKLGQFIASAPTLFPPEYAEISGKVASGEEKDASDSANDGEVTKDSHKPGDRSAWNPLSYIMVSRNIDAENKAEQGVGVIAEPPEPIAMNGRVILYTKLGCQSCKEIRSFLYNRRLRYVEINVDVYPSRKRELEKFTGSCVVPKVLFNEIVIGGLSELKELDESGKLEEKIEYLITEAPSHEAPLTPLSGEDDMSSSGSVDELALIVRKMKESIVVKDRFYKMRRFPSCFLGSEAVNFLSEDQYLEREEAVEFGRKLASKLFFQHVLDENLFEDGNHLYWFMDDNPVLSSQCHNIPRGIIELKPKPIREIASRLRFLSSAICEAYVSDDGKHVDYRTIHGSEEFARYLRIIQELQRVEFQDIPREEKLAFFINLYNMMIIHSVLVFGDTDGAAERRKVLGEFKYVIGGCSYSLSAIQHGILRCNQRPPFTLTKPFRVNDKRSKVALPYLEPLIHFALVLGTRSGPALRCYSPGDIDKELMDSARNFLRGGGLVIDLNVRVVYLSKILKWFGGDFGKNEVEVLKHASNYLEPANSEALLELLASGQLKVIYQPYDWGLNL